MRVDAAVRRGAVRGRFVEIARVVETALAVKERRPIPTNVHGATAVLFAERGLPLPLVRRLFVRRPGLGPHLLGEGAGGGRNKGPIPRRLIRTYTDPPPRKLAEQNFRQAMTISAGDWTVFFTRPLSATILALAALALFGPQLYALFTRPRPERVPGDA